MTPRDQFVLEQTEDAVDSILVQAYGSLGPFCKALNGAFDSARFRKLVSDMKATLRGAAREQWIIIQASGAWAETKTFVADWFALRFPLLKLELAGNARRFHIVGIVDVRRACEALRALEGTAKTL